MISLARHACASAAKVRTTEAAARIRMAPSAPLSATAIPSLARTRRSRIGQIALGRQSATSRWIVLLPMSMTAAR